MLDRPLPHFQHILIVDDDPICRWVNIDILKKLKIADEIHEVVNGQEALDYVRHHCVETDECPELILLNLEMPVMNGYEFLEACQKSNYLQGQNSKIIIVTASINPHDIPKVLRLGAHAVLVGGIITPDAFLKLLL